MSASMVFLEPCSGQHVKDLKRLALAELICEILSNLTDEHGSRCVQRWTSRSMACCEMQARVSFFGVTCPALLPTRSAYQNSLECSRGRRRVPIVVGLARSSSIPSALHTARSIWTWLRTTAHLCPVTNPPVSSPPAPQNRP